MPTASMGHRAAGTLVKKRILEEFQIRQADAAAFPFGGLDRRLLPLPVNVGRQPVELEFAGRWLSLMCMGHDPPNMLIYYLDRSQL